MIVWFCAEIQGKEFMAEEETYKVDNSVIGKIGERGIGREICRLAKVIHPDCIAVVPLYMSCIVIMQSEEEKDEGICTIHAYSDPNWLGEDINIQTLKKEDFHTEFKIKGQRSSPELVFEKYEKTVSMSISLCFDYLEKMEKDFQGWYDKVGFDEKNIVGEN